MVYNKWYIILRIKLKHDFEIYNYCNKQNKENDINSTVFWLLLYDHQNLKKFQNLISISNTRDKEKDEEGCNNKVNDPETGNRFLPLNTVSCSTDEHQSTSLQVFKPVKNHIIFFLSYFYLMKIDKNLLLINYYILNYSICFRFKCRKSTFAL